MKFAEFKEQLEGQLDGVNRYNPQNLELLEDYVDAQLAENEYDLEANLTILKLYQLNPDKYKQIVVNKILIKSIMTLPNSDFVLAKCLIDQRHYANEEDTSMKEIVGLATMLESCEFPPVWQMLHENPVLIEEAVGFSDAIRQFICHVINITFQSISLSTLKSLLGGADLITDKDLCELIKKNGWTSGDEYVLVSNHEATVKTRNIEEKIDFSIVKDVLRSVG